MDFHRFPKKFHEFLSLFEFSRPRPSSAELSQARPGSTENAGGAGAPKLGFFFAPDDQKMSSSIFMVWNSLVTVPFELESDLHSSRSNDTFEHRIFRNSRSPPGEDAASQNARSAPAHRQNPREVDPFLCLLEWGGESLAVPRDENSLRGGGIASRRLGSVRPYVRKGGPPFLHFFRNK